MHFIFPASQGRRRVEIFLNQISKTCVIYVLQKKKKIIIPSVILRYIGSTRRIVRMIINIIAI